MTDFTLIPIGSIESADGESWVRLDEEYLPALAGLDGFGYLQIIWWFDGCDDPASRRCLVEQQPYAKGPQRMGAFATRSPQRPNPLALSTAAITWLDQEQGLIGLAYIDANPGSPVLDIKPYTPSLDRVEEPDVPAWCAHWPQNVESSGDFDWAAEFNF